MLSFGGKFVCKKYFLPFIYLSYILSELTQVVQNLKFLLSGKTENHGWLFSSEYYIDGAGCFNVFHKPCPHLLSKVFT